MNRWLDAAAAAFREDVGRWVRANLPGDLSEKVEAGLRLLEGTAPASDDPRFAAPAWSTWPNTTASTSTSTASPGNIARTLSNAAATPPAATNSSM